MSKKEQKKEPEIIYADDLENQVKTTEQRIQQMSGQLLQLQDALNQERGILEHAKFLLSRYKFPRKPKEEKPEAPKDEKKANLEVK